MDRLKGKIALISAVHGDKALPKHASSLAKAPKS
jgi:hypothetical protein